jgi:plastocyanin
VEVPAGTEVTWTWDGDNRHNVTGEPFSSDTQSEGTFSHTFDDAGTYTYRCTLHPGMEGAVVVTDGGS